VRCPQCGHDNPGGARFCIHCGAHLAASCAACGATLPGGARFCPECGHAVSTAPAAPVPASYTPRHISEQILAVRSAIEGERKQVSVLFCDIVRSSALAAELGPEEFHLVIDRFFRIALAEVHRYEGTINQFLGDGFMALFGAPIAHEDHARRAVLAALGIAAQAEVNIRIGINSGLVVVGTIGDDLRVDYTAFGDTTVLAARLQAAAEPGAVLLSQQSADLVRGYFAFEEVAPVQVKERTVYPLRVTGLGTRTSRIAPGDELSPFTGRDRELAELRQALQVVRGGEGQLVGLAGDPGMGKSRLALEFRRLAEPDAAVMEGRCLSYGAGIAYLPLFEVVRNACGIAVDEPPDLVATKIELRIKAIKLDVSLAYYLRHAFGVTTGDPAVAALDPPAVRARTFDALRQMLVAEAARRPLVVLVEDVHWIDQTSEDFLAEFADDLPTVPILLLVTHRPGYSPPWAGKSFASQLALRPLSPVASEQVVASVLAGSHRGSAAAIASRGDGNPFFLEELARATRDRVADPEETRVPATVQQVLAARIDLLTADQKAALQVAAVLGREFSTGLAEDIWDGGVPLEDRLLELKGLEFLRERHGTPERTFMFTHALTRDVAYDGMLEARRRELHGRAGDALERSGDSHRFEHSELLGYHYSRSAEPRRAIPYLAVAGDRASDRYANEEAVALYRRAIGLIEELDGDRKPDPYRAIGQSLGDVLVRLSRCDEAIGAYDKALAATTDPFQRARLHIQCSDAEQLAHRFPEALARCDLAEQALGPASDITEPQWLALWLDAQDVRIGVAYWLNDTDELARLIERARPLVEAHGAAEQRANFYFGIAQLSVRRSRYIVTSEALEFMWAGHAAAQEVTPEPLWWAGFMVGVTLLWHGDLDQAAAMLEETLQEAERRGQAEFRSRCLTFLMAVARKRGDVDGVREAVGPVIEQARKASLPEYEAMAIANRAWVAWRMGDEEKAATDALAALEMWAGLPVRYFYDWMALWPLVAMALAAGRVEEAAGHVRDMLPPPQQLLHEPARTLAENAVRAWDAGRPADAEDLLRRAVSAAGDLGYL
jgi:class 3 adenylate cyclase/tetratricopeptide (TPR) repeat protein